MFLDQKTTCSGR